MQIQGKKSSVFSKQGDATLQPSRITHYVPSLQRGVGQQSARKMRVQVQAIDQGGRGEGRTIQKAEQAARPAK